MHIHCFRHVAFETPGTIAEWVELNGHTLTHTLFFEKNFQLPQFSDFDALLVMGGPMNVYEHEKFPWLPAEKIFIRNAIDAGKKILGICLGAQLIASALGYEVFRGKEKEIGFFNVHFTNEALNNPVFSHFAATYPLFHWHGDSFDLPENAVLLASTGVCRNQAFLLGNQVLAMQFHLEMNEAAIEQMMLQDGNELSEKGNCIQTKPEIRSGYAFLEANRRDLFTLLNRFFSNASNALPNQ